MRRAVCSGSFDPVTNGHIDVFERASTMFDELIICVFNNIKKQGLFPVAKRVEMIQKSVRHLPNVKVMSFSGLLVDFMRKQDARIIVRGVRSVKDLEYEEHNAYLNRHLDPNVDTVFLLTRPDYSYVSSSGIRELIRFHGSVAGLVPPYVEQAIIDLQQRELESSERK